MLKKTLHLKGVRALSNNEQKEIKGGFWGCQPQLIQCDNDSDCPSCSFGCGITIDTQQGPITFPDVCAF